MTRPDFLEVLYSYCCCTERYKTPKMKQEYDVEGRLAHLMKLDPTRDHYDFPEELLCPLTGTVITEPARVPNHDARQGYVICDYVAAATWVSEQKNNPFNRSPMTIDEIKLDNDFKRKIFEYLTDELSAILQSDYISQIERPKF